MIIRFKSLGLFDVLSAGSIDGINSCAFAIYLLHLLSHDDGSKMKRNPLGRATVRERSSQPIC